MENNQRKRRFTSVISLVTALVLVLGLVGPMQPLSAVGLIEEQVDSAIGYEYEDGYTYSTNIVLDNNTFTGTYSPEELLGEKAMNDVARFLGALHRQENANITTITYGGVDYTWNTEGTLKGSNWENEAGNTLVSVITNDYLSSAGATNTFDLLLSSPEETDIKLTLVLELDILTIQEQVDSAIDYEYADGYTYSPNIVLDSNTFTGLYSLAEIVDNTAMNDVARFLGALHRQDNANITTITYGGVDYTWNTEEALKGSNWEDEAGNTLVSVITNDYLSSAGATNTFDLLLSNPVETDFELALVLELSSVTGVTLNETDVTLEVDETTILEATVVPGTAINKNVSWTSSDETVVTVSDNGELTAIAAGTARITVTTEDGAHTAVANITVTETPEETTPEETTPEETTPEETTPEETTPEETTPEETTPEETTPEETSPEETTPEETTPEETTPEETTPEETTPEETTPEETTPEESTPEETTPEETTPEETTPDETTPEESTPEESTPEETTPEETTPEETTPEGTTPEGTTITTEEVTDATTEDEQAAETGESITTMIFAVLALVLATGLVVISIKRRRDI